MQHCIQLYCTALHWTESCCPVLPALSCPSLPCLAMPCPVLWCGVWCSKKPPFFVLLCYAWRGFMRHTNSLFLPYPTSLPLPFFPSSFQRFALLFPPFMLWNSSHLFAYTFFSYTLISLFSLFPFFPLFYLFSLFSLLSLFSIFSLFDLSSMPNNSPQIDYFKNQMSPFPLLPTLSRLWVNAAFISDK